MTPQSGTGARRIRLALFLGVGLLMGGCSLFPSPDERASGLAAEHRWRKHVFPAGMFDLTGFSRLRGTAADRLTVYIEGDGRAWLSTSRLSPDPTPATPYVLELAVRHPAGNVLYLARPCQYVAQPSPRGCHPRYWSSHRYAPEVIASMGAAIDRVKRTAGARRLVLIGYSGGGVVAALLAARRDDVAELVTIAANLDHAYWTRLEELTPLHGSLNPADFTERLQKVPQRHFAGGDDDIVPPVIINAYVRRMTDRSRTRVIVLREFDHDCCWTENWPDLLKR